MAGEPTVINDGLRRRENGAASEKLRETSTHIVDQLRDLPENPNPQVRVFGQGNKSVAIFTRRAGGLLTLTALTTDEPVEITFSKGTKPRDAVLAKISESIAKEDVNAPEIGFDAESNTIILPGDITLGKKEDGQIIAPFSPERFGKLGEIIRASFTGNPNNTEFRDSIYALQRAVLG